MTEKVLVALGGNALIKPGQKGTLPEQVANLDRTLHQLVELIRQGHQLILTHGNGPQVGQILTRAEAARDTAYELPLDVCVAQSQGEMGYLIQQCFHNVLQRHGIDRAVTTIVSQVVVDTDDPRMAHPSKPIGPFYREDQVSELEARGYCVHEDAHRGYRRVVPSPIPVRIVETGIIRQLFDRGFIVIAGGGGGIPVSADSKGIYHGVEAVIDKDWTSSLLAVDLGVECMLNLTGVEHAKLHFGSTQEEDLERLTVRQAKTYLAEGHFLPGSMKPKIESAIYFLEHGGREVIITSTETTIDGFHNRAGTHLTPD